jgi:hypothetical protein
MISANRKDKMQRKWQGGQWHSRIVQIKQTKNSTNCKEWEKNPNRKRWKQYKEWPNEGKQGINLLTPNNILFHKPANARLWRCNNGKHIMSFLPDKKILDIIQRNWAAAFEKNAKKTSKPVVLLYSTYSWYSNIGNRLRDLLRNNFLQTHIH